MFFFINCSLCTFSCLGIISGSSRVLLKLPFFSRFSLLMLFSLCCSPSTVCKCASCRVSSSFHAGFKHCSSLCSDLLVTSPFLSSGSSLSLQPSLESFNAVTGDLLFKLEGSSACGTFDSDSDSDSADSDVLAERERGEFLCCFSSSFRLFFFFFPV